MNPIMPQVVGLLMLGAAGCVGDRDNNRGDGYQNRGGDVRGDIRERQSQDTCLLHPDTAGFIDYQTPWTFATTRAAGLM
jgi:hypothetical protein